MTQKPRFVPMRNQRIRRTAFEERRAHPGDDLVSTLVTEEVEGEHLSEEEVVSFLRLLFPRA